MNRTSPTINREKESYLFNMSVMLNLYIWGGGLSDQVNVVFNFVTVGPDNNYHSEL